MNLFQKSILLVALVGTWITIMMCYFSISGTRWKPKLSFLQHSEKEDFLINTLGCHIPNYAKTIKYYEAPKASETCGDRAVFIQRNGVNKIDFVIDKGKLTKDKNKDFQCCYRFAKRSEVSGEENNNLTYTQCTPIQNNESVDLLHEVITVQCTNNQHATIYEDSYIVLKKISETDERMRHENSWNVLLLGLDTVSRVRAYHSLPKTVDYLKNNHWLDYRGYQKVAVNTFPNLMAVLAGKNASFAYSKCQRNMQACNDIMMWSQYKNAGYITAYAEDYLSLPDTFSKFKGFKAPPTDHYMRPFFLTGEKRMGNSECTGKVSSVVNVLNYAYEFVDAYKDKAYFGFFWINSGSHNIHNLPTLYENDIISFFNKLKDTGVLNNTFVIFFSDHGIRFGKTRFQTDSFFDERLPMLFMWVPTEFQKQYPLEFESLQVNQNQLVTPYDLYATIGSILQMSTHALEVYRPEACRNCTSLFEVKSPNRNCVDAGVDEKWCTCHGALVDTVQNDTSAKRSLQIGVEYIQNRTKSIETTPCTVCSNLTLNTVLRNQLYRNEIDNTTYYLIAFMMKPGDVGYEMLIKKQGDEYSILGPTDTITTYNVRGNCVINPNSRGFCVCKNVKKCKKITG